MCSRTFLAAASLFLSCAGFCPEVKSTTEPGASPRPRVGWNGDTLERELATPSFLSPTSLTPSSRSSSEADFSVGLAAAIPREKSVPHKATTLIDNCTCIYKGHLTHQATSCYKHVANEPCVFFSFSFSRCLFINMAPGLWLLNIS